MDNVGPDLVLGADIVSDLVPVAVHPLLMRCLAHSCITPT
jgi:hypothetical protein